MTDATAAPESTADLLAQMADLIEADLLARFKRAAPQDRVLIRSTADLTAHLYRLNSVVRQCGATDSDAVQHAELTWTLTRGLALLGTDNIADTVAEQTLRAAMQLHVDFAFMQNPAGSA